MAKKRHKAVSGQKSHSRPGLRRRTGKKEHVKKISFNYEKRQAKGAEAGKIRHPLGIRVLAFYLSLLLIFYFFYLFLGIKSPIAVVFGQVIGGMPALALVMFLIIADIVLIVGLMKRKRWSYYFALAWFAFGIINSLISLILLQPEVVSFTRSFLILSSVTVFVINILAMLYIASEKNYFFAKEFAQKKIAVIDKVFVAALIIFLIITVSIGSVMGYDFYRTNINQTDSIISELQGMSFEQQMQVCNSKPGQQRDLCLLILSIKSGTKDLCNDVHSDFYKFSCLQA